MLLDPGLPWEYLEDGEEVGELDMGRIEKTSAGSHCEDVVLV